MRLRWTGPFVTLPAVCCAAALAGCQAADARYADPIAKLMDRTESHRVRWAAARQAEREMRDDPRRINALKQLVWERGYPADYSNYAIDQLIELDERQAKRFLATAIVLIRDWDTLRHVIDTAVERSWVDFVPALVRNYALRTPVYRDEQRPERRAIEKLRPGEPVERIVLEVFADDDEADIQQRAAAWTLLHRLVADRQDLIDLLMGVEPDDPLTADLRAAATDLSIVPDNVQTITWLQMLRTAPYRGFWQRASRVVGRLDAGRRRGLELRHLPVLLYLDESDPTALAPDRAALLGGLDRFLEAQKRHLTGPTYDGPMDDHPQTLGHWRDRLAWADLLTIDLMRRLMADRRMVEQWFAQADEDLADTGTEYGGLVRLDRDRRPYPYPYEPMIRRHDLIYYPPEQLVVDGYTALAHYHFHAQEHRNRRYAGPGLGDLKRTAETQRFNALVLTFIDPDTLNVDYYQPGEVVVDLGEIHR